MKLEEFKNLHKRFVSSSLSNKDLTSDERERYIDEIYENQEFKNWSIQFNLEKSSFNYKEYCCLVMANHISKSIDEKGEIKYNDLDVIINQWSDGTFGIPIHDGGSSVVKINFCPWCGNNLKKENE